MNQRRHDWSTARDKIQQRMADLRMGVVDLARASGLSEKHIRTLLNDGPEVAVPRETTRWALCDALGWTPESIDRILTGQEPGVVDADDSGEVSPLTELAGRVAEIEAQVEENLERIRIQQTEMDKFYRLLRQLEDEVRDVLGPRRGRSPDGAGPT